jgi:hypothetical protein
VFTRILCKSFILRQSLTVGSKIFLIKLHWIQLEPQRVFYSCAPLNLEGYFQRFDQ